MKHITGVSQRNKTTRIAAVALVAVTFASCTDLRYRAALDSVVRDQLTMTRQFLEMGHVHVQFQLRRASRLSVRVIV